MSKHGNPATPTAGGMTPAVRSKSRAWRLARVRRGRTWAQRKAASKTYTLGKVA
jgi:hypothetical protein